MKNSPMASPAKDGKTDSSREDDLDKMDLSWPERMIKGDGDQASQSDSSFFSQKNSSYTSSFHDMSAKSHHDVSSSSEFNYSTGSQHRSPEQEKMPYARPGIHEGLTRLEEDEKAKAPTKHENKNEVSDTFIDYIVKQIGLDKFQVIVALLVMCLIVAVVLFMCVPASEPKPKLSSVQDADSRQKMVKDFDANFQKVYQNFPSQSTRFWKVVRAACKSVLRETYPAQPAVVMLAGHQEHSRTTECIARHITKVFTGVYANAVEPQMLSSDDYGQYRDADNLKKHIDNTVRATFDGGSRAIHVSEIHRIPGKAAAMFHAFCDNDNAPYKDASIILTVHTDTHIAKEYEVEDYLSEIWGNDLDIDTLSPLLSRMANSIALVQREDDKVLDKHC